MESPILPIIASEYASHRSARMAAIPGLISILLAWTAVSEVRAPAFALAHSTLLAKHWDRPHGKLLIIIAAVALFSLGNSSDLFLILRAQNLGMKAWTAPALGLVFNVVYASLSWPAGKLSDRLPRRWLIMAGYLIYAAVYAGFALLRTSGLVWFLFAVYGTYYALTEGVIKAWIADLAPSHSRASVYGVLNWVVGVAAFPASLLAGWLWQHYSPATPFALSSILAFASGVLLLFV